MHICIFEDKQSLDFEPLVFNRPVYDLICGTLTLLEKVLLSFDNPKYSLHCRKYLQNITGKYHAGIAVNNFPDEDCLFINGRIVGNRNLKSSFDISDKKKKVFLSNNQLAAVFVPKPEIKSIATLQNNLFDLSYFAEYEKIETEVKFVSYIWDLININGDEIKKDVDLRLSSHSRLNYLNEVPSNVHLLNEDQIFIEENVKIKPGVVLDASGGPIYIEKNSTILSNAVIAGPFFLGESSVVKSCATIYSNTSIGKLCKIGGEIEQSVFMPYSNKQHAGFLGHSYLGSWVNLGADTNNSDLKNNYSKIKISLSRTDVDTGLQFLGLMMGDHSKSAINTMFNTGTIVGFSCNVFGSGFPEKFIPSFSWGGPGNIITYDLNKSIETAKVVTSRRKVDFTKDDELLFQEIFDLTKPERDKKGL